MSFLVEQIRRASRALVITLALISTVGVAGAAPRSLESLRSAYEAAAPGSDAWSQAAIAFGRLAHHLRKFATARQVLRQFLTTVPAHPQRIEVEALVARIGARFQVKRTTVGVLLPLSGPYRRFGRQLRRGIELALGQEPGLDLIFKDTKGRSHLAREAARNLILEERAMALLGPVGEDASLAAAQVAERHRVPILTLTRRRGITGVGRFVFRNFLTNHIQGQTMARYAVRQLKLKDFAILYPNTKYGIENMRAFWDEVVRLGGTIRAVEHYSSLEKEHRDSVRKLVGSYWLKLRPEFWRKYHRLRRRTRGYRSRMRLWKRMMKNLKPIVNFDAIFIPDFASRLTFVIPWLKYYDIEFFTENVVRKDRLRLKYGRKLPKLVYLLGTNGWNSDRLHKRIGDLVWRAVFCDAVFKESDYAPWTTFVNIYRDRHRGRPGFLAAIGYDSYRILRQAIVVGNAPTRDAVRLELKKVNGFRGATGVTSLDGDDVAKELRILSVERQRRDYTKYEIKEQSVPAGVLSTMGAPATPAAQPDPETAPVGAPAPGARVPPLEPAPGPAGDPGTTGAPPASTGSAPGDAPPPTASGAPERSP